MNNKIAIRSLDVLVKVNARTFLTSAGYHDFYEKEILTCDSIGFRAVYCKQIDYPTDYGMFFSSLIKRFQAVDTAEAVSPHTAYYIATASDTPQMHSGWLIMAAGSEIFAKILQARPPQFVTVQRQAADEVEPLTTGCPRIQAPKIVYEQEELRRTSMQCVMEEKILSFARRT